MVKKKGGIKCKRHGYRKLSAKCAKSASKGCNGHGYKKNSTKCRKSSTGSKKGGTGKRRCEFGRNKRTKKCLKHKRQKK